ncbi:MAG: energy transducer TonB [Rhodobacteraceae bacterium]|nr:MAG: energy transducer TonB [Paracoccaceae bacterium]
MKRAFEITAFTGLACIILIGLFGLSPKSGAQSSGAGGEEFLSLEAATETVVEMVESWERPPLAQTQVNVETEALTPAEAPPPPSVQIELSQAPRAEIKLAITQPIAEDVPDLDDLTAQLQPPVPQSLQLANLAQPLLTQPPLLPNPARSQPAPPLMTPPELDQTSEDVLEVDTATAAPLPKSDPRPTPVPRPKPRKQLDSGQKAEQASAGRVEQRAAGSGGGAQAGAAGASQASTLSAGRKAALKNVWGAKIRARIERRKRYPSGANGNASVVIRLIISRDGRLLSYKIAKSSGNATFDQAAISAVTRVGRFPTAPKKLSDQKITVNLPINFSR